MIKQSQERLKLASLAQPSLQEKNSNLRPGQNDKLAPSGQRISDGNKKIPQFKQIEKPVQGGSALSEEQRNIIKIIQARKSVSGGQISLSQDQVKSFQPRQADKSISSEKMKNNRQNAYVRNEAKASEQRVLEKQMEVMQTRQTEESFQKIPILSEEERNNIKSVLTRKSVSIEKTSSQEQEKIRQTRQEDMSGRSASDEQSRKVPSRKISKTEIARRERKFSLQQEAQSIKNQVVNLEPEEFSQLFSYAQRRVSDVSPQMPGYPVSQRQHSLLYEDKIIEEQPASPTSLPISEFLKRPVITLCENCSFNIVTKLEYHSGTLTCLCSGMMCIITYVSSVCNIYFVLTF